MKSERERLRDLLAGVGDSAGAEPSPEEPSGQAAAALPMAGEGAETPGPADGRADTDPASRRAHLSGSARSEDAGAGAGSGSAKTLTAPPSSSDWTVPPSWPTLDSREPFPRPFGRYELRARLGSGGMADVYLAHDSVLDIEVALKVPRPPLVGRPYFREQFLHEARALARLDHPNICRIYDHGCVGEIPYLSMQRIQGDPLKHYRPTGPGWLEPGDAVALCHTLALALALAHSQGVIHRDLKPGNVLVKPNGQPMLTDFGLALRLDRADALLPGPEDVVGTLAYMAPEQVDVRIAPLGPGCDIHALGVLLYELLTGQRPFPSRERQELLRQIREETPVPPSQLRPGFPGELDRVCLRALAKPVRDRFLSMEEFAETLAHCLAGLSSGARGSAVGAARPLVKREALRFSFVGYGSAAPPSASFRDRLYLDVGNDLRPGVLDHHHLVMSTASTTRLVLNRPDLLDAIVTPRRQDGDPFSVVTHEFPDLDAAAAAFLAVEYLARGRFPEGADLLARYVDRMDEGYPGMSLDQPFTLYAAYQVLANRPPAGAAAGSAEQWQQALVDGIRLVAHVLEQAGRAGTSLEAVDAFACPGLFRDEEREAVRADIRRYEAKLADPDCRARVVRLRLPGRFGGREEVAALLVRDVQNEHDPARCLFFKNWARTDARRSPDGKGFVALASFQSEGPGQTRRALLSVTPDSRVSLRGLGALLDEVEAARRRQLHGEDDRVRDPVTGALKPVRFGYANADPWYDGRAHGYTIVDAPREGTVLTADDIEELFLHFGA